MAPNHSSPKYMVCFLELSKRCPPNQIQRLKKLHQKHKEYHEREDNMREGLTPIDWEYYKRNVRAEAVSMVEMFEKKYSSFKVPYPEDKHTKQIDKLKEEVKIEIAEFIKKSNERIAAYQKEIERIKSMLPFDQMTWEDYCILYPDKAPDFINRPTYWPHNPEEQIGFEEEEVFVSGEDEDDSLEKKAELKKKLEEKLAKKKKK